MLGSMGIITAAALDVIVGDPPTWPHLVRFMGRAIEGCERLARRYFPGPKRLRLAGGLIVLVVAGGFAAATWGLMALAAWLWPPLGWLAGVVVAFQCLSAGQLWREVDLAARALREGRIKLARRRLAMIVGRDVEHLDSEGIRRALVETLAENLNDAVVAPCSTWPWAGRRRRWPTRPSTPWTPCWATATSATATWGWCRPGWTMWPAGYRPASPPC